MKLWTGLVAVLLLGCGGGGGNAGDVPPGPAVSVQESQCLAAGWQRLLIDAAGLQRAVLWKAPPNGWSRGALVVMHGGGGQHANFCVANSPVITAQVQFTTLALAQGFAVFLPGHSSGGYMAVRAATKLADRVKAFAPVASGDPYGWFRDCTPRASDRVNVFGAGFDSETRRQIIESGACNAAAYPQEKAWDGAALAARPAWRAFHHVEDGINDVSCVEKLGHQLRARGYPETPAFRLTGGARSADAHAWLDSYNQPLLDFFSAQLR